MNKPIYTIRKGLLIRLGAILLFGGLVFQGYSQKSGRDTLFGVHQILANDSIKNYIDIRVNAQRRFLPLPFTENTRSLEVLEMVAGGQDSAIIRDVIARPFIGNRAEEVTVLVMLDVSGSMRERLALPGNPTRLDMAKRAIKNTVKRRLLPLEEVYFSTFDEVNSGIEPLDTIKVGEVLVPGRYTHLYECLAAQIEEMKKKDGEKVIIMIADGENDFRPGYTPSMDKDSVFKLISSLDTTFRIYPVGIGMGIDTMTLAEITSATPNQRDTFQHAIIIDTLPRVTPPLRADMDWTHTIQVSSKYPTLKGNRRTFTVKLGTVEAKGDYHFGAMFNPKGERTNWGFIITLGVLLTGGFLAIFLGLIPYLRWLAFRRDYVRRYWQVKSSKVAKYDPLTKTPFMDQDLVVVKCPHITTLATWRYKDKEGNKKRNQCVYHPVKCPEGVTIDEDIRFFSPKGVYRKAKWLWFGAIGGFLGWGLWAVFEAIRGSLGIRDWLMQQAATADMQSVFAKPVLNRPEFELDRYTQEGYLSPIMDNVLVGIFFAVGLTLLLSIVEERGIDRKIGWLRVTTRTLIGALIGGLVFFGGSLFHLFVLPHKSYLPGLVTYLVFGIAIGLLLAASSTIKRKRAFIAGAGAAFIAYHVYYILPRFFFSADFEWAKLLSFIVMGGIMGYFLIRAMSVLDHCEIKYIIPENYLENVPIVRWLKAGQRATIGRGSSAVVRVKWKDRAVAEEHAELLLQKERVYIRPFHRTLINGKHIPLNVKTPLRHADRITFGDDAITILQYRELRSDGEV